MKLSNQQTFTVIGPSIVIQDLVINRTTTIAWWSLQIAEAEYLRDQLDAVIQEARAKFRDDA